MRAHRLHPGQLHLHGDAALRPARGDLPARLAVDGIGCEDTARHIRRAERIEHPADRLRTRHADVVRGRGIVVGHALAAIGRRRHDVVPGGLLPVERTRRAEHHELRRAGPPVGLDDVACGERGTDAREVERGCPSLKLEGVDRDAAVARADLRGERAGIAAQQLLVYDLREQHDAHVAQVSLPAVERFGGDDRLVGGIEQVGNHDIASFWMGAGPQEPRTISSACSSSVLMGTPPSWQESA